MILDIIWLGLKMFVIGSIFYGVFYLICAAFAIIMDIIFDEEGNLRKIKT